MRIFVGEKMGEEGFRCPLIEWAQHTVKVSGGGGGGTEVHLFLVETC